MAAWPEGHEPLDGHIDIALSRLDLAGLSETVSIWPRLAGRVARQVARRAPRPATGEETSVASLLPVLRASLQGDAAAANLFAAAAPDVEDLEGLWDRLVGWDDFGAQVARRAAERLQRDDGRVARFLAGHAERWADKMPFVTSISEAAAEVFAHSGHPRLLVAALRCYELDAVTVARIADLVAGMGCSLDAAEVADHLIVQAAVDPAAVAWLAAVHGEELNLGDALVEVALGEHAATVAAVAAQAGDPEPAARWLAGLYPLNPPAPDGAARLCSSLGAQAGAAVAATLARIDYEDPPPGPVPQPEADPVPYDQIAAVVAAGLSGLVTAIVDGGCSDQELLSAARICAERLGGCVAAWDVAFAVAEGWDGTVAGLCDTSLELAAE